MAGKKKKPTANPARGFATTSVASKPKPAARSDRTHSSSKRRGRSPDTGRTHSSTKRRDRSPDTVAHRQPSSATLMISEFIALTESKKKLETLFTCDAKSDGEDSEDVEATNEKEMRNKMMRILKKRRQEIADTIDEWCRNLRYSPKARRATLWGGRCKNKSPMSKTNSGSIIYNNHHINQSYL